MNETPFPLIVSATSALGALAARTKAREDAAQRRVVVPVAGLDLPPERAQLRLEVAEREDLLRRLVGLQLVAVDDDPEPAEPVVRGSLERLPVLALLQLAVAGHHDDDAVAPGMPLRPRDPASLGDAHAERARVRLDSRHADVRMPVEATESAKPCEPLGREHAEPVERRVQARHVVALGREEHVAVGIVETDLRDVQLAVEEVDDDVERTEARAEMPGSGTLHGDERVQPADVREKREACISIAVRGADAIDVSFPTNASPSTPRDGNRRTRGWAVATRARSARLQGFSRSGVRVGEVQICGQASLPAVTTPTPQISVVIPCLNEEEAVGRVVEQALDGIRRSGRPGEVIVVDNASTDRSAEVAAAHGARVVSEKRRGYGSAYLAGLAAAQGEYVVMGDADETYPLQELAPFVDRLEAGDDLVIGSRFQGTIHGDAMPFLNRFVGNPILTGMLNLLFGVKVSDAHCGMRAIRKDALPSLDLHSTGMEFASEMVFKAYRRGLTVAEIPIDYYPRVGESKLNRFGDAWRHVRFMLLYSPSWLYLYPGAALLLLGLVGMLALATGPVDVFGRTWQIHTMLGFVALTLIGAQVIQLGVFARTYARVRIGEHDPLLERIGRGLKLEHGLLVGGVLVLLAFAGLLRGRGRVGARRVRDARARVRDRASRHGPRPGDPDRLRVVLPRAAHDAAAPWRAERRGLT